MCNTTLYPNLSEQTRFIRSYVNHRPQFSGAASSTPNLKAQASPTICPGPSPIIHPGASTSTSNSPSIQGRSPGPSPSIAGQQQKRTYAALNLGPPATPPAPGSLDAFTLDARGPPSSTSLNTLTNAAPLSQPHPFSLTSGTNYDEEERAREQAVDKEVQRLLREVRLWRVANSAQWVAWGIVQAKVRGMDEALEARALAQGKGDKKKSISARKPVAETIDDLPLDEGAHRTSHPHLQSDPLTPEAQAMTTDAHNKRPEEHVREEEGVENKDEEFDYLAYAQSRALFFWGDVLEMGLLKTSELPRQLVEAARRIDF
jgi:choline kinase